jgi:protocatechuate 3,4-dioxygenase alpha subunit
MSDAYRAADLTPTPGQTVGPFFKFGVEYDGDNEVVRPYSPGSVLLSGTVYDGAGVPIPDAMIEIWGADADGTVPSGEGARIRTAHLFSGFGRSQVTAAGHYELWTRNPGATGPGKAPFFAAVVFARGLTNKLHTRIYLPDDQAALEADPFLASLTEDERRTVIATRDDEGNLRHDIRLQGENETVFVRFV